jgi:DNA-binding transcriptional MerR regulator
VSVAALEQPVPAPPEVEPLRPQKSQSAFRTISEVADELEVAQHVLRFWESKFPQVRPLKRGGGRRYYRPEDVELLRQIRALLYDEGYTIRGAQKLLKARRAKPATGREGAAAPAAPASPRKAMSAQAPAAAPASVRVEEPSRELQQLKAELAEVRDLLRQARLAGA